MQLDAALRSFLLHCLDAEQFELFLIYKTSSAIHTNQYAQLLTQFSHYGNIHFYQQGNFRLDVLDVLSAYSLEGNRERFYRFTAKLGPRFSFLSARFLNFSTEQYVLFLVDDNIFVRDFSLNHVVRVLSDQPDALGFSLRLGTNTHYCYTLDRPQAIPNYEELSNGVMKFDWTKGEHDFGYPLEVSSSVYRIEDLLSLINRLKFENPNFLESRMALEANLFRSNKPILLSFEKSVTFCNPVNKVQEQHQNLAGQIHPYSSIQLAQKFSNGERIDIQAYCDFTPVGCHQEVELHFLSKGPG